MNFLADESVAMPIVRELRRLGHDVMSIKEISPGMADHVVLSTGVTEQRVVLTFDKDFGELAFHRRLPAACGVVLFRLNGATPDEDNARAIAVLTSRTDWRGHFAVVSDDRIRIRSLPSN